MPQEEVMDQEVSTDQPDSQDAQSSEPEEIDTPSTESTDDTESDAEESTEPAPIHKFKVDGKELDFPKELQAAVNDENLPVIRQLLEKAHGIDAIKGRMEEVRGERDQVKQAYQRVVGDVLPAIQARDAGNLDEFFKLAKVSPDQVAEWMLSKIERAKLPKELQQVYNERDKSAQSLNQLQSQVTNLMNERNQSLLQARSNDLKSALSSDQVKSIAESFDARAEQPGSFELAVIEYAAFKSHALGRDLTVEEAVQGYLKSQGHGLNPAAATPANASPKTRVIAAPKNATIPNVGNTSVSPTGQKPRSVADLRKLAKEMMAD